MKRGDIDFAQYSDGKLIQMVTDILIARDKQGESIGTINFEKYYHVDFTYSQATHELETRGYRRKVMWCKDVMSSNASEHKYQTTEINLAECKRINLRRYQATFSDTLISKIQALLVGISKKDKKSIALEMLIEPEIDRLLTQKENGKLLIKDVHKRVVEAEEYVIE